MILTALIYKDIKQLLRDPKTLVMVLLMPVIVLVMFVAGYGGPGGSIPIAVANLDREHNELLLEKEQIETKLSQIAEKRKQLTTDLSTLESEYNTVMEQYNQLASEKESLESQINQLLRERAELLLELKTRENEYQKELDETKQKIDETREAYLKLKDAIWANIIATRNLGTWFHRVMEQTRRADEMIVEPWERANEDLIEHSIIPEMWENITREFERGFESLRRIEERYRPTIILETAGIRREVGATTPVSHTTNITIHLNVDRMDAGNYMDVVDMLYRELARRIRMERGVYA